MSEISFLPREERVNGGLNIGVDKTLKDLEGGAQQRDGLIVLWIHWGGGGGGGGGEFCLRIVKTSALVQILGILRLHKQCERNSHNQDLI